MTDQNGYVVPIDKIYPFKLSENFLSEYKDRKVDWGFGPLSYIVFKRTYARPIEEEDRTEEWWETCKRVIEGMFTIQKAHCKTLNLQWDNRKAQKSAQEAYDRMFEFKWLPPGRGLWAMGTEFVYKRGGSCLNNCGFVSTQSVDIDFAAPFVWVFIMSMYGVGCGSDTRGDGKIIISPPRRDDDVHVIPDSREGWAEALQRLLTAFSGKGSIPAEWDFSEIRPEGAPIKGFGGTASGPEPLKEMLEDIEELLVSYIGKKLDSTLIVDLMNLAGKCVVAGGIRRTAEIMLGDKEDQEFLDLKLDQEKLNHHRWASNNSIFSNVGMDYSIASERTAKNGEPGFFWLDKARKYGRLKDPENNKDHRAMGQNPCGEQTLEDRELCCLVENFPANHNSFEDFQKTLKYSYMYAKTVTLVPTQDPVTNAVMMRNRRIGCSISGIVQNIEKLGLREHLNWCDRGFDHIQDLDKIYSEWLCVPRSIKTTSVKPSGTVSILAGATPGVHFGHSKYYLRRIRVSNSSPIWKQCEKAGYHIEDCIYHPQSKVITFPIKDEVSERGKREANIWEKVSLAALHQEYWADNQVSCTVEFRKGEGDTIPMVLEHFEDRLKAISFLPMDDHGYEQPPYEEITEEEYEKQISKIDLSYDFSQLDHEVEDKFCDGETCVVDFTKEDK